MPADHCDATANVSLEIAQLLYAGLATWLVWFRRGRRRAPSSRLSYALLESGEAGEECDGDRVHFGVAREVGPYWVAEVCCGVVVCHKLLSLGAANVRNDFIVPRASAWPVVGGFASSLAYLLVARLFAMLGSGDPGNAMGAKGGGGRGGSRDVVDRSPALLLSGQGKGDSISLQRGRFRSNARETSIHALSSSREMIARPKMSQIEWQTIEI